MKVSVIIPCYNAERYLEACLRSVLAQTMEDLEVLVIDDGSTDATLALARSIEAQDARVHVFHQANAGVCAARNRGLSEARGEFVTFVDGDDLLVDDALERMLAASQGVDLVVCAHETFEEDGSSETVWPEGSWIRRQGEARRRAAALRLIEGDCVLNIMCNKLHRRALLEREHLRLQEGIAIAEDVLFNLEAVLCGQGIAYVPRVTYRYRMHGASATHRRAAGELDVHLPWFAAMQRMLMRRGQMERYYPAFFDSVVLRLYKDGGVGGVMKAFNGKARPLLVMPELEASALSLGARTLRALCRHGLYPAAYPLIFPVQLVKRKLGEAAYKLRVRKEKDHERA